MVQNSDGRWSITDYELITIHSGIAEDVETQTRIDSFMSAVDSGYLADLVIRQGIRCWHRMTA